MQLGRNRLLLITVLSILLCASLSLSVKAEALMWTQTYGGTGDDTGSSLVITSDGGYALAGTTFLFEAGGNNFWLIKTDVFGNVEWNQTYGGTAGDGASQLVVTSDGGYALAGYTDSFGAGGRDFWLVKTDMFGNMEWNQTYGGTADDGASQLVVTSDGGYALAGYTDSFGAGGRDFWLVKTDMFGNMEWNQTYGGTNNEQAYSLVVTSNGSYALSGLWDVPADTVPGFVVPSDFWLVKTDMFGNMEWNQTYEGSVAYSLVDNHDGGFALAGATPFFGAGDRKSFLMKTDALGNVEWNQTYEGGVATSLIVTSDGGYALAGFAGSLDGANNDFWLIKTDAVGNVEWNQTYDGTELDVATSLVEALDGGYALLGSTQSTLAGWSDFWLVKTDEFGVVPEAAWVVLPLVMIATLSIFLSKKKLIRKKSET